MIFNNISNQNDLLGAALQASVARNDAIANNITNAETPGYKKRSVSFEKAFNEALDKYRKTGKLDLGGVTPTVQFEHLNYYYRIDENNIDIESEMVDLYENAMKYEVLISGVMNNYKRLNLVLNGIK